jgi:pimeloyl-ACP methyl ester carboxylesterase
VNKTSIDINQVRERTPLQSSPHPVDAPVANRFKCDSWPQLTKDFAQLSQAKLTMPVLSIGGEKSLGKELGEQAKLVAGNATLIVLPNAGHWILEERPKETSDALVKFL